MNARTLLTVACLALLMNLVLILALMVLSHLG